MLTNFYYIIYIHFNFVKGLERLIISKTLPDFYYQKIERIALDMVKSENELFSLSALNLLITCIYTGKYHNLVVISRKYSQNSETLKFVSVKNPKT